MLLYAAVKRLPLALDKQSPGTHVRFRNKGCTGCTYNLGAGFAASLIVLSELLSSFPAASCDACVHPAGMFDVSAGKKLTVSAGQPAPAAWHTAQPEKRTVVHDDGNDVQTRMLGHDSVSVVRHDKLAMNESVLLLYCQSTTN